MRMKGMMRFLGALVLLTCLEVLVAENTQAGKVPETEVNLQPQVAVMPRKFELVILEEPPSLGVMKLLTEPAAAPEPQDACVPQTLRTSPWNLSSRRTMFGMGKVFLQNYTSFQRRIRDCLIKKLDEFGFDVKLLSDNEIYEEYKTKDSELVGVCFDSETRSFVLHRDLLKAIQANNPDTLVLYYRLETLDFDEQARQIRTTVALSVKNLASNVTKSFGTDTYVMDSMSQSAAMLVDEVGFAVEKSLMRLMYAEDVGHRLVRLVQEFQHEAMRDAGPIHVTFNGMIFEAKNRKKVLYHLKKSLVAAGITTADRIWTMNHVLQFTAKPEFSNAEELYFEKLLPILVEMGLELRDDQVFYGTSSITIKP